MPPAPNAEKLYDFLSNPKLVTLMERVKITDDFLDVITLGENQHSKMLSWCLNPNEGHAQGDAVLKDFLMAAYRAGQATNTHANKTFFETWTPARIRTASFGSAFVTREFGLQLDGENGKSRLDLFIVDRENKIMITIENKVKAKLGKEQLSGYYERVTEKVARRPVFNKFLFLYVVVDSKLETYSDDMLLSLGNRWALLDYTWLQLAAERARLHIERNNEAAQMLMAYCQKQTGWESPNERKVSELAGELVTQHEEVVNQIMTARRIKLTNWTPGSFSGEGGELLVFVKQHTKLCEQLVQARGIGAVRAGLRTSLPSVQDAHFRSGRTWLDVATPEMFTLGDDPQCLPPLHLNIFRDHSASVESSLFTLRVCWWEEEFDHTKWDWSRLRIYIGQHCRSLKRWVRGPVMRSVVASDLTAKAVTKQATDIALELNGLIASARRAKLIQ
ncbi:MULTISPECIES: PD-(D/E)XK nuclease family protein [unclassified Massilia]|uniref:PDDEXK-like family protein n=1 Tax=unclassified Massilia TaxID=2609279 RepID=UPI00177C0EF8|nr:MULTISPECIES: PD-(D/E)XK nuclease family protein [unclassified Massilia]MBD8532912.1 PD-(D/E)XK nuclease family protein [Massilia sp. CFBP 13647]MBD8676324.1 PD-(D/E)XK nuclease family protein [Massilia sp. CFBP 13721]